MNKRELNAILEGEQKYKEQIERSNKSQAILKKVFPPAQKKTNVTTAEDREALKIRKYVEMFRKQEEMEIKK